MPQDANHQLPNRSSALTLYAADDPIDTSASAVSTSSDELSPAPRPASPKSPARSRHGIVKRVDSAALEASATQVIDEVFEDVDYLLDGAPPHPADYASGAGSSFTTNVFMPSPQAKDAEMGNSSTSLDSLVMLWGIFPAIAMGLCLGLSLALGIALNGRQTAEPLLERPDPAPAPEDEAFLAYLDQSLETIERQTPEGSEGAALAPGVAADGSKRSSLLSADPFAGASSVILPPPTASPAAGLPAPPAVSSLPLLPAVPVQTTPIRLAPAAPPLAPAAPPAAPPPAAPPVVVAPTAPAPATTETPSPAAPEAPVVPNISPSPHVLVGLLQLGDRSAAIFEFDDGARRIRVGEAIGGSGWSLVSISQDEAVIRRNGEVRSIYIGQRI